MKIISICLASILVLSSRLFAAGVDMHKLFTCDKILPQSALVKSSSLKEDGPYGSEETIITKYSNTLNKCFRIKESELVYLIDKDQAIYKAYTEDYFNPWIMIDFNKSSAPISGFKGVVKGVSTYTYKDGKGIPRKIPYMIVIKRN